MTQSPQNIARELMPQAALQQAMHHEVGSVNNCRIYAFQEEWIRIELEKNPLLRPAASAAEMEALARDHTTRAIYIPLDSNISLTLATEILRRTGASVQVFIQSA